MRETSESVEGTEQPKSAAQRALEEFGRRIEGDASLDAALKEALLADLTSNAPAELDKFVSALGARGKE